MLAWILLVASAPTIACAICSAFLAYKERPQWVWFAMLAVLAEIGYSEADIAGLRAAGAFGAE